MYNESQDEIGHMEIVMLQVNLASHFIESTYVQTVPNRTLADAIKAGKYDHVDLDINEKNFPLTGETYGKKDMALFSFGIGISSEDAVLKMDEAGYRPATLMELLVIGENWPELQQSFPLVALGSSAVVCRSRIRRVPVLLGSFKNRRLHLSASDCGWFSRYRFLGVRKLPSSQI